MIANIFILVVLFIVPVILLYFKIIPFRYRVHTLTLITLASVVIILSEKWGLDKLGLAVGSISSYWAPYLLFTVTLAAIAYVFARLLKRKAKPEWWRDTHFIYGFVIVSVLQEFIFRGFLIPELQSFISTTLLVIAVNALLFGFMHVIYSDDVPVLTGIFLGGIGFAAMYIYFPSLILVIISHAILNFLVVYFGFLSQERPLRTALGVQRD